MKRPTPDQFPPFHIRDRLINEFTEAATIAAERFPNDYDAALRYARDLVSEEGGE